MQYIASGSLFITGPTYDFFYEASGALSTCSFGSFESSINFFTEFKPRDVAWIKKKAEQGLLRKVAIKNLYIKGNGSMYFIVVYKDTYNSFWNEGDLIDEATAIDLATAYWERIEQDTEKALQALTPICRY